MGIPNILSIIRLLMAPVFVLVYFSGRQYANLLAAALYIAASVTDIIDGIIARKFNMTSELGKILDPLGDKVMTFTVLICITVSRLIPVWVVLIFAIKEILMGLGGLFLHRKVSNIPHSNYLGKAATVVFFLTCTALMIFPQIPKDVTNLMVAAAILIMLIAFCSYIRTFAGIVKKGDSTDAK